MLTRGGLNREMPQADLEDDAMARWSSEAKGLSLLTPGGTIKEMPTTRLRGKREKGT